ncbi:MAG: hypothetical protein DRP09_17500 [Candidatus Thorarchaeota archaeon]|nr:MAG: hypothetical protein DRP09_17500 [Candidatus Thorarchaeota archaeon]
MAQHPATQQSQQASAGFRGQGEPQLRLRTWNSGSIHRQHLLRYEILLEIHCRPLVCQGAHPASDTTLEVEVE